MGRVSVEVGGRTYALSCSDGEEDHLAALGHHLSAKADELTAAIGTMSEPRLLLMAGLQIADELFALRAGAGADPRLTALVARIEALADTLEGGAT
jgi:cell division protein ZapA